MLRDFHQDRQNGMRRVDAAEKAVATVLKKAAEGDKRVLFNEREWAQKRAAAAS